MTTKTLTSNAAGYLYSGSNATLVNPAGVTIGSATANYGVSISGTGDTLLNAGSIASATTASSNGSLTTRPAGLYLGAGGAVTNQAGGTVTGFDGIFAGTAALTVLNGGVITGAASAFTNPVSHIRTLAAGVYFNAGGSVTNRSGGTISGAFGVVAVHAAATVLNAGTIEDAAGPRYAGVNLAAGGTISNASGGLIIGVAGVSVGGTSAATVVNSGSISGTGTSAFGSGIVLLARTAAVTNLVGGTITGADGIYGYGNDLVVNAGVITGNTSSGIGIYLYSGGTITNQSGGTIAGGVDAVKLQAGYTGLLVIDPGAVFTGTVDGGNSIGATAISTLELAADPNPGAFGTLNGLGSKYINFAQISVDSGAFWAVNTNMSLGAGATLTNAGYLFVYGSLSIQTLLGGGLIQTGDNTTLTLAGTVASGQTVAVGGTSASLSIVSGVTVSTAKYGVTVYGSYDTVANSGVISGAHDGVHGSKDYHRTTILNSGSIIGGTLGAGGGVVLPEYAGGFISNSTTSALIQGGIEGVYAELGPGTVNNLGTIIGIGPTGGGNASAVGVQFANGGTIVNGQSGSAVGHIYGYYTGIHITGPSIGTINYGAGTVTNFGTVIGYTNNGIALDEGGKVTNGASGSGASAAYIHGGNYGVLINFTDIAATPNLPGTVSNYGTITAGGNGAGVELRSSGTVVNAASAVISGYFGVQVVDIAGFTSTVTNAGTIISTATSHTAVDLSGAGDRLIDDPGAVFQGDAFGSGGTLELASAATSGTLSGLGAKYGGFALTTIDSGAQWTLAGTSTLTSGTTLANAGTLISTGTLGNAGSLINSGRILLNSGSLQVGILSGSGTIAFGAGTGDVLSFTSAATLGNVVSNMAQGQTLDLTGQTITSTNLINTNTLQIGLGAGGPMDVTLDPTQDYTGKFFHFNNSGINGFITEDTTPCYLAGTRIRTDRGEVVVEDLRIGDRVITRSGEARPIKWIGTRSYSSAFAAGNRDIIPILIKQGALGENVPCRDLCVSPLHAMFLDGVLIQAEHLVNGESIRRCPEIDPIRYFHIELEQHDVIFAEGALAETFVDCDSRGMFHNAPEFAMLYPDDDGPRWAFCAPRIESGPVLEHVRHAIDQRAGLASESSAGPLQGNLDGMDGACLTGWAFDPTEPDHPVTLEVLDGDGLIARVNANRYRDDLESAGIGDGRHGFELRLARGLSPATRHEIRVRRLVDGRELPGSPYVIEPHDGALLVKHASRAIEIVASAANDPATLDGLMSTLLEGVDHIRRLRAEPGTRPVADDRLLSWARAPRARAKRALIIDDILPRRGASNAILSDIAGLRALGWQMEFVASAELARADAEAAALIAWGVKCHRAPLIASVEEVLRRNRGLFDLVYLHRISNVETYGAMVRQWQPRARVLYSAAERDISGRRQLSGMRLVDAVIAHSATEAATLADLAPGANVHLVPRLSPDKASQALAAAINPEAPQRRRVGQGGVQQ